MKDIYLLLGAEAALADRALNKLMAELRDEKAEVTTLSAGDVIVGDIPMLLRPLFFLSAER